jgi:hypothetical protein
MLARNYLISPRVTSGEPITSMTIPNEKRAPTTSTGALAFIMNTPRKIGGAAR